MESQTITLVLGAIVVLIIVNYLFLDENGNLTNGNSHNRSNGRRMRNIVVTSDMIESVRSIAPGLTTGQIRADLMESGSVQSTVDRYLSGALVPEDNNNHIITDNTINNTEFKYAYDTGKINVNKTSTKHGDGPFGGLTFEEKKQQMILENRKELSNKRDCDYIVI